MYQIVFCLCLINYIFVSLLFCWIELKECLWFLLLHQNKILRNISYLKKIVFNLNECIKLWVLKRFAAHLKTQSLGICSVLESVLSTISSTLKVISDYSQCKRCWLVFSSFLSLSSSIILSVPFYDRLYCLLLFHKRKRQRRH